MEIQIKTHANDIGLNDYQECILEKYNLVYPFSKHCISNTYHKIIWQENVKEVHTNYYDHKNRITTFKIYVAKKFSMDDLNDNKYLSQDGEIKKEIKDGFLVTTQNTSPKINTNQDEQFIVFERKLLAHAVYHDDKVNKSKIHLYIIPKIYEIPSFMFQPSLEEARKNLCFYIRYYNDLSSNRVANKYVNFYINLEYGD